MVEDYKTIDLEQISVKLHRRIYKITKDEYDKQIEEYLPHFEELKGYKNSKSFKFDKKDWEKYVDDKEKS